MIENILSQVQMPSRYLGTEINTIHKNWHTTQLHVALAFPDLYEIGTSHFGIQILYSILNNSEDTLAERVFSPGNDMEDKLRSGAFELASLESKTSLKKFDIIGFSLLYELNYTNMLNILSLANIPFLAEKRDNHFPLLIAGGPCTFNPEPIAIFFDAIVIGDGEETILEITKEWKRWEKNGSYDRKILLKEWSKIQGVYIPSFFESFYDSNGYQKLKPRYHTYKQIKKSVVSDLKKTPLPTNPIVPFAKPVHDRLKIELSRGCTRGCRFCQAGMIYRPVRERSPKDILKTINESIQTTGYEDLSLLSLSTGDYCCILPLMEDLIKYSLVNNLTVSLPSLRAEILTSKIIHLIKDLRKTGFTIAPEAGSQRLRNVINKNICEKDIIDTVKSAFSLGWKIVKLYFMIGLPTECQEDLQSIVDLVKKLNSIRKEFKGSSKINVSVTTFVPKAHTPFQWIKQISLEDSKAKITWLKKNLKISGIHFKWQDPHVSFIEGKLARGNRCSSTLLINAFKNGCKFDGWSNFFNFNSWEKALKNSTHKKNIPARGFANPYAALPWDHINIGVSRNFFLKEWEKSIKEQTTHDCHQDKCQHCGVCDSKLIRPVLHEKFETEKPKAISICHNDRKFKKIGAMFRKTNNAKYFGHLEMVKIFHRSLRRAKISVKYSEGFHPSPKISFDDALPIGVESLGEFMTLSVLNNFETNLFKKKMNAQLPSGLKILKCFPNIFEMNLLKKNQQEYIITCESGLFTQTKLDFFMKKKNVTLVKENKNGKRKNYDLKQIVKNIKIHNEKSLKIVTNVQHGNTLRPKPILHLIFEIDETQLDSAKIIKL